MQAQIMPQYQAVKSLAAKAISEKNKIAETNAEHKQKFFEILESYPNEAFGQKEINYILLRGEDESIPSLLKELTPIGAPAALSKDIFLRLSNKAWTKGKSWASYVIRASDLPQLIDVFVRMKLRTNKDEYFARAYEIIGPVVSWKPSNKPGKSKSWR